jgi:GNAT superfamily N-acetyltransferase
MTDTNSIAYRQLEVSDYDNYYKLINEFRETKFTQEQFSEFVGQLGFNHKIYVLTLNKEIIATTTVIYEQKLIFNMCKFAHIEDVCVLKSYQKGGYGSKLLQHVIQEARKAGCWKLTLVCAEPTVKFYNRNGLEKRGVQCSMLL